MRSDRPENLFGRAVELLIKVVSREGLRTMQTEQTEQIKKIPSFCEETQKEPEEIKRILILTLSIFGGGTRESVYQYAAGEGETAYCTGSYQLSPVPRMMIDTGRSPDEIITIVNEKTTADKEDLSIQMLTNERVRIINADPEKKGVSPLDYFADQIHSYKNGKDIYIRTVFYNYKPVEKGRIVPPGTNGDGHGETQALGEILDEIRSHPKAELFIDVHGGMRPQQEIINSVLSLLKMEGRELRPDHIFSVEFSTEKDENGKDIKDPNGNNVSGFIVNAGESVETLDFVSGMNALINYGRADALKDYMERPGGQHTSEEIMEALNEIATGIQMCSIGQFESGISRLKSSLESYRKENQRNEDGKSESLLYRDYLSLFIDDIEEDYRLLLQYDKPAVTDEIRWCLDKGYYQQMLTIAESRIPAFLHEKGIFSYDILIPDVLRADKKFELNNHIFNNVFGKYFPEDQRLRALGAENPEEFYIEPKNESSQTKVYIDQKAGKRLLALHCALKGVRNISNHANEETGIRISDLRGCAERYLKLLIEIVQSGEKDLFSVRTKEPEDYIVRQILDRFSKDIGTDLQQYKNWMEEPEFQHFESLQRDLRILQKNTKENPKYPLSNIKKSSELVILLKTMISKKRNNTPPDSISFKDCENHLKPNPKGKEDFEKTGGIAVYMNDLWNRPNKNNHSKCYTDIFMERG